MSRLVCWMHLLMGLFVFLFPSCDYDCCRRLFLTQDNEFAGDNQKLTVEETVEYTSGMSIL